MSTEENPKCPDDSCDMQYHEDDIGDCEVINGTMTERWWECSVCGHTTNDDPPDDSYLDNLGRGD